MQPENSLNNAPQPERMPMPPGSGPEGIPSLPPLETGLERGQERSEQRAEAGARVSDAAVTASVVTQMASAATPIVVPDTTDPQQATPLVAADEDVIEKEWVDKAKQIIQQTRDDPYARTKRVNELQREYLQKRYGKIVGAGQ